MVYTIFIAGLILLLSTPDYAWMIGESLAPGEAPMTICNIPIDGDPMLDMLCLVLVLIGPMVLWGLIVLIRKKRIGLPLIASLILLLYWWWGVYGQTMNC